jgi:hypothetical protein
MPLDSQNGSVADRLRNFFRITGRIPSPVDETVVPTANLVDLDGPPWRTTDENFQTSALNAQPVAAQFGYAGVYMPRNTLGVAVIKQIQLINATAAVQIFDIFFVRAVPNESNIVVNVEHFGDSAGGLNPRVPVKAAFFTIAAQIGEQLMHISLPANTSLIVPVMYAIRGVKTDPNPHGIYISSETVNVEVRGSIFGTYHPSAL